MEIDVTQVLGSMGEDETQADRDALDALVLRELRERYPHAAISLGWEHRLGTRVLVDQDGATLREVERIELSVRAALDRAWELWCSGEVCS